MRFAIVSREVYPLARGGIAAVVTQMAHVLAREEGAEVMLVTSSEYRERYEELRARRDPGLPADDVRVAFVEEVQLGEAAGWFGGMHAYSARVLDRLRELYPDGGPDVVEFNDYLGEGAVTIQAKLTGDPLLRDTVVAVRLHTTQEICNVLDGEVDDAVDRRATYELERFALRHADVLLHAGEEILETYRRYYGRDRLAPGALSRHAVVDVEPGAPSPASADAAGPVRLLYMGRLERRKGVADLVRAVASTPSGEITLTMVGSDTNTAPLGLSLKRQLELSAAGDPRIRMPGHVEREELPALLADHDAVVVPSIWECWPNVALEALRSNRPIIATPVGGLVEMAAGGGGWLAHDTGSAALADLLERVLRERGDLRALADDRAPRRRFEELTDERAIVDSYRALRPRRSDAARSGPRRTPLVSVVIPYYRLHRFVAETVANVFESTWRALEVIVVNDGSFEPQDTVLDELAERFPIRVVTQPNNGLAAARNLGIRVSRGRYVLPFDADDLLHPTFVERCVGVLERDQSLAYATSWLRYVDEAGEQDDESLGTGYQPITNDMDLLDDMNVGGPAIAVFPRTVFGRGHWYTTDLTSYEDWLHLIELRNAGLVGLAIPERLIAYRVRSQSMMRRTGVPHRERLMKEMRAHVQRSRVRWTSLNA